MSISPRKIGFGSIHRSKYWDVVIQRWSGLSNRDQYALILLFIFLIVFLGVFGGYSIHEAKQQRQDTYQATINEYFWLRAQASNIDPTAVEGDAVPIEGFLTRVLTQADVTESQVLKVQDTAQISFTSDNQGIVSNLISFIINEGYVVDNLNMQQNPETKVISVQATITN